MQQILSDEKTNLPSLILYTFDGKNLTKVKQIDDFSLL